ncbi:unnamed protein product, partial [marine sediment metagenome]
SKMRGAIRNVANKGKFVLLEKSGWYYRLVNRIFKLVKCRIFLP